MIDFSNASQLHHFLSDALTEDLFTLGEEIEQDPQNIPLRFQMLAVLIQMAAWQAVIDQAEKIARIDPGQTAMTLAVRGLAHAKLGCYEPAHACITQSLTLNPNDPATYAVRADVCAMQGNWAETLADYSMALSLDPTFLAARIGRARAYVQLGRRADARVEFELAQPQFHDDWERTHVENQIFKRDDLVDDDYYESVPVYIPDDDDDWGGEDWQAEADGDEETDAHWLDDDDWDNEVPF